MPYTEADFRFLEQVNRVMSDPSEFSPSLIEDVEGWKKRGLGIGLYSKFDASSAPLTEEILVGVALPLEHQLGDHLVVLISGDMMIVGPRDTESIALYKQYFSRDIRFKGVRDLNHLANFDNPHIGSRSVLRNNNQANREYINELVIEALKIAKRNKLEKQSDARST